MKTKLYIKDIHDNFNRLTIRDTNEHIAITSHSVVPDTENILVLSANSFNFCLFLIELQCCPKYRTNVVHHLHNRRILVLLHPTPKEILDLMWGERVVRLIWERIEIEHMLSWLSTLGGAFSALGDYSLNSASIAGKISLRQLGLAMRIGDPFIITRCLLFLSIALMQRGHLRSSKHLLRRQYEFAKIHEEYDRKLCNMCLGIHAKLQYLYYLRHLRRLKKGSV